MGNSDTQKKVLDIETAKEISELLEDGKSFDEIRKRIPHHGGTLNAWVAEAMLMPAQFLDGPFIEIRTAILERVLKDTVILDMFKAATIPSEKVTRKSVILTELSKHDKALLEHEGHEAFIEKAKDTIVLKVEETVETIPPQTSLYKEVLKAIGTGEIESSQNLMPFNAPHRDCPPV